MQAGDRLGSFIRPFDPAIETVELTAEQRQEAAEFFEQACRAVLMRYADHVRGAIRDSDPPVGIFELSLQVPMSDGSFLHVIIHGTGVSQEEVIFNITLNEYDPANAYLSGYMYSLHDGAVIRTANSEAGDEDDMDGFFFSAIEYEKELAAVGEILREGDEEQIQEVKSALHRVDELWESVKLEEMMGYNHLPVPVEEVYKLAELLFETSVFDPPAEAA